MKITELKITRLRTIHEKDSFGNRVRSQVEYLADRPVQVVEGGKRFGHFFVDSIVVQMLWYCIDFIVDILYAAEGMMPGISSFGIFSIGLTSIISYPIYYIICEHIWQRTPGKFLTKSVVINDEGDKPDLPTNILRNIIRLVPFEIFSCLGTRGWHDIWSDTYVVSDEEYKIIKQLLDEQKEEK